MIGRDDGFALLLYCGTSESIGGVAELREADSSILLVAEDGRVQERLSAPLFADKPEIRVTSSSSTTMTSLAPG